MISLLWVVFVFLAQLVFWWFVAKTFKSHTSLDSWWFVWSLTTCYLSLVWIDSGMFAGAFFFAFPGSHSHRSLIFLLGICIPSLRIANRWNWRTKGRFFCKESQSREGKGLLAWPRKDLWSGESGSQCPEGKSDCLSWPQAQLVKVTFLHCPCTLLKGQRGQWNSLDVVGQGHVERND